MWHSASGSLNLLRMRLMRQFFDGTPHQNRELNVQLGSPPHDPRRAGEVSRDHPSWAGRNTLLGFNFWHTPSHCTAPIRCTIYGYQYRVFKDWPYARDGSESSCVVATVAIHRARSFLGNSKYRRMGIAGVPKDFSMTILWVYWRGRRRRGDG